MHIKFTNGLVFCLKRAVTVGTFLENTITVLDLVVDLALDTVTAQRTECHFFRMNVNNAMSKSSKRRMFY